MRDTNELRAAAERGRKLYRESPSHVQQREQCLLLGLLSEAWLAERHADDAEPVTFQWLTPMASVRVYDGVTFHGENSLFVYANADGDMCATVNVSPFAHAVKLKDRGQFRLLCRALGIELKEGAE